MPKLSATELTSIRRARWARARRRSRWLFDSSVSSYPKRSLHWLQLALPLNHAVKKAGQIQVRLGLASFEHRRGPVSRRSRGGVARRDTW
ncbi:hypothetical protein E1258_07555 [Micromonospora sp. KC207]|uniref:hypothetical protein n=1 Tax=Micromonospora sp. KC207 TaxID=2530377 RepID=UPI00104427E3|nr:hypothetical protein [Micromonospora sp. KC207]TDC64671.1 hypothetical protein E1258_07555 [Micromonospora sp. KC207]